MYYHRPPKKKISNYILPFIIVIIVLGTVIFGWQSLNDKIIDSSKNTYSEKVFLNIESGSAKAMTVGKTEWQNAPDKIYLYRGERLKTGIDGRSTLTFFDKSITRLNTSTEVAFAVMKKKNDTTNIEMELVDGEIWTKVERINNPDSGFSISTKLLTIDTREAVFAVKAPGTVYMMGGNVQLAVKHDDEVIKTYTLGVGQQFIIEESQTKDILEGKDIEAIYALSEQFKKTNWYRWNTKKDNGITAFEETDETEIAEDDEAPDEKGIMEAEEDLLVNSDRIIYVTKPSKNTETNKSSVDFEGRYDTEQITEVAVNSKQVFMEGGKWYVKDLPLQKEGENQIVIKAKKADGTDLEIDPFIIVYDTIAPDTPKITDPAENDKTVAIEDTEQMIEGEVSKDTNAVIVNDYRLAKYVPGSGEFQYYAKMEYGNLRTGENEYKVYAKDKAGNISDPAIIILELTEEVIKNAKDEKDPDAKDEVPEDIEEDSLPSAQSKGGVIIKEPNNGESFSTKETEFVIEGDVPEGTHKVEVNDYTLSLFESGNTEFSYRAFKSIGNLIIGEKNTYVVKAFDKDDELLGEASITIDVESGSAAAPILTIPTSKEDYQTSLDTIVIGGTVGKWVNRVYINDREVKDYIPGSEKFRMSVKLTQGTHDYTVSAEKDGKSIGTDIITITYTP